MLTTYSDRPALRIAPKVDNTRLYGAWVTPKGELIPVPYLSHTEVACMILGLDDENLPKGTTAKSIFCQMYELGYMRLTYCEAHTYKLEYRIGQTPTKSQIDIVEQAINLALY